MSEILINRFEIVPALDGIMGPLPNFIVIRFTAWIEAGVTGTRNNISGEVRVEAPWPKTREEFEALAQSEVRKFLRQAAQEFAPA